MELKHPTAGPTFFRTYSRRTANGRESYADVCDRTTKGLAEIGKFTQQEYDLVYSMMRELKVLPSGRWMWVGGTDWIKKPENFYSAYNCSSTNVTDIESFGLMMALGMMGCGTGAVLEEKYISQLPPVRNSLQVQVVGKPGQHLVRLEETLIEASETFGFLEIEITVGDSRQGWVDSMLTILQLAFRDFGSDRRIKVTVDISSVRPDGTPIKGFGGVANPIQLSGMYTRLAAVLNRYVERQLDYEGVCLLLDEVAVTIVAGNVRRYAGMRQFDASARLLKQNLWQQDEHGNWRIDPERDALRMSNHTRVYHRKPSLEECIEAVRSQYYSGEGAIQYAPEAIARANADLLRTDADKRGFLNSYETTKGRNFLISKTPVDIEAFELDHRLERMGLNPCGEILGSNFLCVSGDTPLLTRCGMYNIAEIVGSEVEIWNGKQWSKVTPFQTGTNRKLYRVKFGDGTYIDATENHKWFVKDRFTSKYKEVKTSELMSVSRYAIHTEPFRIDYQNEGIDVGEKWAYTLGVAVGDGTVDYAGKACIVLFHEQKMALQVEGYRRPMQGASITSVRDRISKLDFTGDFLRRLKTDADSLNVIASWSKKCILQFVAGLADTDGSNTHANGIRIYISGYERARKIYLLLLKCGIRSSVNLMSPKGTVTNKGTRSEDMYYLQITECAEIPCQRLDISKGKSAKFKGKWQVVKSVEELPGLHSTYCVEEREYHKVVFNGTLTGNCNLSEVHLNQLDPLNLEEQKQAFAAGALSVAALLHHEFVDERFRVSRELDPIVGVSFTGLFDFFVNAFGTGWLRWWEAGRPVDWDYLSYQEVANLYAIAATLGIPKLGIPNYDEVWDDCDAQLFLELEKRYFQFWKDCVREKLYDYCDRHNLKRPNRYTTTQPAGTKSLLTGASSGWHPPKAQRYIRRITMAAYDPVALACLDYGYSIVPSQSCKDEFGNLLNDPYDPRVGEWLVEIPVEVPWANLPGADKIDISKFSAAAQFNFYMQGQRFWAGHNQSGTIELRENEIEPLATLIHDSIQNDEGYVSCALLARFDASETFPRLPFEPISKERYSELQQQVLNRRKSEDFQSLLEQYDKGWNKDQGVTGCDSDKCMLGGSK